MKMIASLLALFIVMVGFSSAFETEAGPYKMTVNLTGFTINNVVGPIEGAEGIHHTSYAIGINEGSTVTPSPTARRMAVDITHFATPIPIDNKDILAQAAVETSQNLYPGGTWNDQHQAMIDGKLAWHFRNTNTGVDFLCYFKDPNTKVSIGMRDLTLEEITSVLRTFKVI